MTIMESKLLVQILSEWKVKLDESTRIALKAMPAEEKREVTVNHWGSGGFTREIQCESLKGLKELSKDIQGLIMKINHGLTLQQEQGNSGNTQQVD